MSNRFKPEVSNIHMKTDNDDWGKNEECVKSKNYLAWVKALNMVGFSLMIVFSERYRYNKLYKIPIELIAKGNLEIDVFYYFALLLMKRLFVPGEYLDNAFNESIAPFWFLSTLFRQILRAHDLKNA